MDSFDSAVLQNTNDTLPNITLSPDQEEGKTAVCDWFESVTDDRFVFAGLAGTGKSSILPFIMAELGLRPHEVHYCAYTGKAAMVMRSKGLPATTMHRLMYDCVKDPDTGELVFERKLELPHHLKLVVVDEASMVGKQMQIDLESYGVPVLYVGDHGQLPPVGSDMSKLMTAPDFRLEKIHRQAEGNPIIKAAMYARQNGKIPHGKIGETVVKLRGLTFPKDRLLTADQVLCGKNVTRKTLNQNMRKTLGRLNADPEPGDKLICLKNNWNSGLVNGMIGTLKDKGREVGGFAPHFADFEFHDEYGEIYKKLKVSVKGFVDGKPDFNLRGFEFFDFGYAITVHKAQGSQWDNLVVFEEWLGDSAFHAQWLYTAVTRAAKNLIIVQG